MQTTPGDWCCDLGLGGVGVAGIWCQLILFWEVMFRVLRSGGFFVDVEKAMPRRRGTLQEPREQQDGGHALATVGWLVDGDAAVTMRRRMWVMRVQDRVRDDAHEDTTQLVICLFFFFCFEGKGRQRHRLYRRNTHNQTWALGGL